MKHSTQIKNLLAANAGTLTSSGVLYRFKSGTDNLVVEVIGQDCIIYFEGTEPTLKEWVNNFKVNRADFHGLGEFEVGFSCNVGGLIHSEDKGVTLLHLLSILGGNIALFGNSRACPAGKAMAMRLIQLGIESLRFSIVLFGCPMCGDSQFKRNYDRVLGAQTKTINGMFDIITLIPFWGYQHGEVVKIYTGLSHVLLSSYLKRVLKNEQF